MGDACDNCVDRSNGPNTPPSPARIDLNQRDTDRDGYGNACDADFNNTPPYRVDISDIAKIKSVFNSTTAPHQDLNGSGRVDIGDVAFAKSRFNQPPGPSAFHLLP